MDIGFVELMRGRLAAADIDLHARTSQLRKTASSHLRIRIDHRHDDPTDFGLDDERHTGRGAFLEMTAGFEGDVEGAALGARASLAQGNHFGMRPASLTVESLPDDRATIDDDCADHGIGAGEAPALGREAEGQGHIVQIARGQSHRFVRLRRPVARLLLVRPFAGA